MKQIIYKEKCDNCGKWKLNTKICSCKQKKAPQSCATGCGKIAVIIYCKQCGAIMRKWHNRGPNFINETFEEYRLRKGL